jgi:hypothetical protein
MPRTPLQVASFHDIQNWGLHQVKTEQTQNNYNRQRANKYNVSISENDIKYFGLKKTISLPELSMLL